MPVSTITSCMLSSLLSVLLFAGMQLYKVPLASSQFGTIFGGFLGSIMFILTLTAVNNFEVSTFGKGFQAQLFPEVLICLLIAMISVGTIHRVCVTTCFVFSLVGLYYINKISNRIHSPAAVTSNVGRHK